MTALPIPPEELARRVKHRLEHRLLKIGQRDKAGNVYPMAMPVYRAKEADQISDEDREIRFRFADPIAPDGDERLIFRTEPRVDAPDDPAEQARLRDKIFGSAFDREKMSLEDLIGQRIKVTYRLVREMARIRGLVTGQESLAVALATVRADEDLWTDATTPPESYRVDIPTEIVHFLREHPFLALLPPEIADEQQIPHLVVPEGYNPDEDHRLRAYIDLLDMVSKRLGIPAGSLKDPEHGRLGLQGLLDPQWCRLAFPTRLQIVAWEEILVEETLDLIVRQGQHHARKLLVYRHGLMRHEINALMSLAAQLAVEQAGMSREETRAVMILKLDEFARRSRVALNMRDELSALKHYSVITGLSTEQPDNELNSFIDVMRRVAGERTPEAPSLPEPPKKVLNEAPQ